MSDEKESSLYCRVHRLPDKTASSSQVVGVSCPEEACDLYQALIIEGMIQLAKILGPDAAGETIMKIGMICMGGICSADTINEFSGFLQKSNSHKNN